MRAPLHYAVGCAGFDPDQHRRKALQSTKAACPDRPVITFTGDADFWYHIGKAETIGALGIRVEKPAEIGPALQQALKADRPVVIDVVTDIDALAPVAISE